MNEHVHPTMAAALQPIAPVARSTRAEVRNPVVALPGFRRLLALSPEQRGALVEVLQDIARDARDRAEKSWRTHKAPMALYWKCVAVYAGHIARGIKGSLA